MKITVDLPFLDGQMVKVLNYRKRPSKWEEGRICNCSVRVNEDATFRVLYSVFIENSKCGYVLHVDVNSVKSI